MKVTKVLLLVVVLVMALTVSAMASETQWRVVFGISGGSGCELGTAERTSDSIMNASAVGATSAGCFTWTTGETRFINYHEKPALNPGDSASWTLYVWVGEGFESDTATVNWKIKSSSLAIPASIGGIDYELKVKIIEDPTGTYDVGTEWLIPSTLGTTAVNGPTFSDLDAIKYTQQPDVVPGKSAAFDLSPLTNGKAVKMSVTMAPVSEVPEPGSMLALATGLVGIAGGLLRRRK